jgi:hypothetical protein
MDSQIYVNLTGLFESHVKANIKPFLAERIDKLVSCAIIKLDFYHNASLSLAHTAVSEEGQRMLAIALSTNNYDP